jgi:hypothetical protein
VSARPVEMATSSKKKQRTERIEITPPLYLNPKVRIERRIGSPRLYARVFMKGKWRIKNTGEVSLGAAVREAEKFLLDLLIAERAGDLPVLPGGPAPVLFKTAYESFIKRREASGYQSAGQIQNYRDKWPLLKSELESMPLTDITEEWLEALRAKRKASTHIVDSLGRSRLGAALRPSEALSLRWRDCRLGHPSRRTPLKSLISRID